VGNDNTSKIATTISKLIKYSQDKRFGDDQLFKLKFLGLS